MCWNTASKSTSALPSKLHPRTLAPSPPLATLHAKKPPFAPTLTESVNMRSENAVTRGSFFRFCLMVHDSVIYGPTPLTLSLVQFELHNPRILEIRCWMKRIEFVRAKLFSLPRAFKLPDSVSLFSWTVIKSCKKKSSQTTVCFLFAHDSHY